METSMKTVSFVMGCHVVWYSSSGQVNVSQKTHSDHSVECFSMVGPWCFSQNNFPQYPVIFLHPNLLYPVQCVTTSQSVSAQSFPFFSTQLKVFISEVREQHSNWIIGSKPRWYSIRIVASGIGYSHSQCQLFIREKALMCGKKNSHVTSSQISVNSSILMGACDGISYLELLSIVLCSVSIFQNSSCCQTELSGCIPTLFLESGNRFISVLNMNRLTNPAILVVATVWTVKAYIVMFFL